MKRHYYLTEDLDDLESVERDLHNAGLSTPQVHVLSKDDAGVDTHRLHSVEAVLRKDVVHGTQLGAIAGVIGAVLVLVLAGYSGLTETYTWIPAVFLAVVILGFCTWEGGLIGIQEPHVDFRRFQQDLEAGRHILFVDFDPEHQKTLETVIAEHPKLEYAGKGSSTPRLMVKLQEKWATFMKLAP